MSHPPRGLSGSGSHGSKSLTSFESVTRSVEWEHSQRHSNRKHLLAACFMPGTTGEVEVSKIWVLASRSPPSCCNMVKTVNWNCVQSATGIQEKESLVLPLMGMGSRQGDFLRCR